MKSSGQIIVFTIPKTGFNGIVEGIPLPNQHLGVTWGEIPFSFAPRIIWSDETSAHLPAALVVSKTETLNFLPAMVKIFLGKRRQTNHDWSTYPP